MRICSEDALFGAPEIRTGGPYIPAVWPWVIGMTKARELLYTGNLIDAQEAKRLNLVNEVVPLDELEAEGVAFRSDSDTEVLLALYAYFVRPVLSAWAGGDGGVTGCGAGAAGARGLDLPVRGCVPRPRRARQGPRRACRPPRSA